jgi:DNA-binding MarR family transcriptional regulator
MPYDLPMSTEIKRGDDPKQELLAQPHVAQILRALIDYRASEEAMRRRTGESMRMGASDLQALRFLLKAQGEGRIVSGRDLANHLGMTSASVTALLDRLSKSGHVQRTPHPTNRRSNMITATEKFARPSPPCTHECSMLRARWIRPVPMWCGPS